ncbi:MAG: hypothetical protein LBT54_03925, partial [Bifidobacteriaceae bacterium]|jgi:hypothetical protein|nr:hypothetical protein [Bifidobacteriaceae bacterium]
LSADATARPLAPREGAIDLRPVTPDAFDAIAADAGTRARWAARLASVEAHLAAHGTAAGPTRAAADPTRAAADPTRTAG